MAGEHKFRDRGHAIQKRYMTIFLVTFLFLNACYFFVAGICLALCTPVFYIAVFP